MYGYFIDQEWPARWIDVGKKPAEQWWLDHVAGKRIDGKPILDHFKKSIDKWERTGQSDFHSVFEYHEKKYGR